MRFFHREIEHGKHPRLIRQKSAAKLVRILPARVSYFIQERFHRKSGVRMAHGAPPLHRHFILRTVQIHLNIRNAVNDISGAFHRRRVNSVFNSETSEHGSVENRLAHNRVGPCYGIAVGI